jgi:hypothetical protein
MKWCERAKFRRGKASTPTQRVAVRFMVASYLACMTLPVLAGPPYQTDDPEPVDYKHYEFYIASQQTRNASGRSGTAPHFEFNYGALPDVHLHIIAPVAFNSPSGDTRQYGYGDTELGIKYRFIHETDSRPMVGTFPIVITPTGNSSKGLGNGGSQIYLPIWFQKKWGDWQTYAGGGYWIMHGLADKNYWFAGWQIQKELSEHLTLGAEVFHRTEQVVGQGETTGFNLGGSFSFNEHNHLLFSVGKGVQNVGETNRFSSYLAYQWTY